VHFGRDAGLFFLAHVIKAKVCRYLRAACRFFLDEGKEIAVNLCGMTPKNYNLVITAYYHKIDSDRY